MKMSLIAAALVVSLAAVACDDGDDPTPEPTAAPTPAATEAPATEAPMSSEAPIEAAQVTGTIILPDGAEVPADATIDVIVEDQSLADAAAVSMGSQEISGADVEGPGIPFAVGYDPATIVEGDSYGMRVRIEDADGSLLYINDTNIPVITRGSPVKDVEVPVIAIG